MAKIAKTDPCFRRGEPVPAKARISANARAVAPAIPSGRAGLVAKARRVIQREAQAVQALAEQLDEDLARIVELMLDCRGRILVTGEGTSHAIAQRFAHLLACCGCPALSISAADCLHGGAGAIVDQDVVFFISKGGHSRHINNLAEIARQRGAKVIALTENPRSPLAKISDALYKIKALGDVDPYGMIATGSSLVNAAACDALCVLLLELKGYTKEQFAKTHPEGAVGKKLARRELRELSSLRRPRGSGKKKGRSRQTNTD
jgi:D-arabinose 5-phosphate isomerase GutQ